jgi:hypothetical protein
VSRASIFADAARGEVEILATARPESHSAKAARERLKRMIAELEREATRSTERTPERRAG